MEIIKKISDGLFKIEKLLVNVLISVMLIAMVMGVTSRYVFNSPINGTDEVAIFSFVWLSFIGGSMSIKLNQAASVSIVTDFLKGRKKQILSVIVWAVVFVFSLFFFILSIKWILSPSIGVQKSDSLQMPMLYPYLSVPTGFFFLTFHTLSKFLESLSDAARERGIN